MAKRQCAWNTADGKCPNKCGFTMESQPDGTFKRKYATFCDKHQKLIATMIPLIVNFDNSDEDVEFPEAFLRNCFGRGLIQYRQDHYAIPSTFTAEEKERCFKLLARLYVNWLKAL